MRTGLIWLQTPPADIEVSFGTEQWLALGAIAGALAGVWLGKYLEQRAQTRNKEREAARAERELLTDALTTVELLLPRLDPLAILGDTYLTSTLAATDVAKRQEALEAQADRAQELLVRAGNRSSSLDFRRSVESLEPLLRACMRETSLALGLQAHATTDARALTADPWTHLRKTLDATNVLRAVLGLTPRIQDPMWAEGPTRWREFLQRKTPALRDADHQAPSPSEESPDVAPPSVKPKLPGGESEGAGDLNLLDLSPPDFERLVQDLLSAMSLPVTVAAPAPASADDGGVDMLVSDGRPLVGGKIAVQAKRYSNPVPASSVRELYGAMLHEQAGRGVFITTSDFTRAAYKFSEDKPIELISGITLLHLLRSYLQLSFRIERPQWADRAQRSRPTTPVGGESTDLPSG